MLRRAVINHLRTHVPSLGGRVYQAFLSPADATRPYATVKLGDGGASNRISYAGYVEIEIRIYQDMNSFLPLDSLEREITAALHGSVIWDEQENPPEQHEIFWLPGVNDFVDEERKLIGRLIVFRTASLFERR